MNTSEKETEELTESQKRQVAFGRKLMAAKRATQKEAERHLDMPETKALLDKLGKKLNDGAK